MDLEFSCHGTTALAFRACHALVWEAATFRCLVERMPAMHHNLVCTLGEYLDELEARFRGLLQKRSQPVWRAS